MDRLPGFRDFYPEPLPGKDAWSAEVRQYLFDRWRTCALRYGFREYDGPPLEPLELYTAKSGDEIVGQLYHFLDKGQRAVAMRPEMTPSLARMVAAHHRNYPKPIKWFAIPQLFRYERQQKGRLREHFQLNADIFGEKDPAVDAEIIALLIDTLRLLGLDQQDFVIRLSSRNAWQDFFVQHGGRPEQSYSFFQIIDKLERDTEEQSAAKLSGLGFSMDKVQSFISTATPTQELAAILDNLAARGLQEYAKIDYNVIRGLAYYTGPVFEAFDCKGEFRAIAGGGRYDNLVSLASEGKVDLPALGFGMGDVVLTELLKSRGKLPSFSSRIEVFCLIDDEASRSATLKLVQLLREAGRMVEYPLTSVKSDKQFKRASELGAKWVIQILMSEGNVLNARARNLGTRHEMVLPLNEVVGAIASVS